MSSQLTLTSVEHISEEDHDPDQASNEPIRSSVSIFSGSRSSRMSTQSRLEGYVSYNVAMG